MIRNKDKLLSKKYIFNIKPKNNLFFLTYLTIETSYITDCLKI